MTRPNLGAEPSMEDILASIRRIIAEDPPGSRPGNDMPGAIASKPVSNGANGSSAFRANPADPFAALRAGIVRQTEPGFSAPSGETAERIETSRAKPLNIEDQMAEILGSQVRLPAQPVRHEPTRDAPSAPASVQAAIDSLISGKPVDAVLKAEARPGFTISRDGFLPSAKESAVAPKAPAADPFDFALGPSPFARGPAADPASEAPPEARRATLKDLSEFGSIVPAAERAASEDPKASSLETANAEAGAPAAAPAATSPAATSPAATSPAATSPAATSPAVTSPAVTSQVSTDLTAGPEGAAAAEAAGGRDGAHAAETDPPMSEDRREIASAIAPAPSPVSAPAHATAERLVPVPASVAAELEAEPVPVITAQASVFSKIDAERQNSNEPEFLPANRETVAETNGGAAAGPSLEAPAGARPAIDTPGAAGAPVHSFTAVEPIAPSRAITPARPVSTPLSAYEGRTGETRTMEDTVAELLRPMLRSWLAENMPRIVERALRRELEDSSRSEHKSAAE